MANKFWGTVLEVGTSIVGVVGYAPIALVQSAANLVLDEKLTIAEGFIESFQPVVDAAGKFGDEHGDKITGMAFSVAGAVIAKNIDLPGHHRDHLGKS